MQLFDIEVHSNPLNIENVVKLLDKAINIEEMPIRQKLLFSQRKIEFLEDFGSNVEQLQKTKEDHEKLTEVMKKEAKIDKSAAGADPRSGGGAGDEKKGKNGENTTTYGATNSAAYGAAHASNYDQYGSRYNYNQYYQGYYQQSY